MIQDIHGGHLIIPQDKVPVAAYQALYHKLTSKTEKLRQIFDDAYLIRAEDILQLDAMLCQTVKQFPVQGKNSVCNISMREHEKLAISSMEKFSRMSFSTNKPTEAIEYIFDFFTILPVEIPEAEDIIQKFKLIVKMDQDFIEENNGMPFLLEACREKI